MCTLYLKVAYLNTVRDNKLGEGLEFDHYRAVFQIAIETDAYLNFNFTWIMIFSTWNFLKNDDVVHAYSKADP